MQLGYRGDPLPGRRSSNDAGSSTRGGRGPTLLALALALGVLVAAAVEPGTRTAHGQEVSGSHTFLYADGQLEEFQVPGGVFHISVDARGGHGGGTDHTPVGGRAGVARATIAVTPGEMLGVTVGRYGGDKGGPGCGDGGDHGAAWGPSSGHSGAGGGGGSCVAKPVVIGNQIVGWSPLVWAGGGGGGGGDDSEGADGGAGGNGGIHPDQGFPGHNEEGQPNGEGRVGGCGGCRDTTDGDSGEGTSFAEAVGGGGGGGGGGYRGGGGGNNGVYRFEQVARIGGSGGGGGLNWIVQGALDPKHSVSPLPCDSTSPGTECDGAVTLSWGAPPRTAVASAGNHSHAAITQDFPTLAVTVRDANGIPVAGVPVEFKVAASGPSGTFPGGLSGASAFTGPQGVAAPPRLRANAIAGGWTLQASVEGISSPVHFELTNDAAPTTTVVSSSANPSSHGEPVDFVATVRSPPSFDEAVPTGVVAFAIDGVPVLPAVPVDTGNGRAVLPAAQVPQLAVGGHTVQASYQGDLGHLASEGTITQEVERAATAVALSSTPNPSDAGEEVIFQAAVTPQHADAGTPTGTVDFEDEGGTTLASEPVDEHGEADFNDDSLPLGTTKVIARYGGDANFEAGTGSIVQSVGPAATATLVSSSVNPAHHGEPLTWTASVRRTDQGAAVDGTVSFDLDGEEVCPATELGPGGDVSCQPPAPLGSGEHSVIAEYEPPLGSGDDPSHGTLEQWVTPARSLIEVSVEPEPSVLGGAISLRATVSSTQPGQADPPGTVQFGVDGEPAGDPVDLVEGEAELASSCTLPVIACGLGVGGHLIEAVYVSSSPDVSGGHATGIHRVDQAPTATLVSSSADPVYAGEPVRFTARVTAAPGAARPFGPVQFLADGAPFSGPVGLVGGAATSPPIDTLSPGDHQIVARFLGSGSYAPSEATLTQRIEQVIPPRISIGPRRARVGRRGSFRLRLRCAGTAGQRCTGVLVVATARGVRLRPRGRLRAGARLAFRSVSLPTGSSRVLPIDLGKRGARALRGRRALGARVRLIPSAETTAPGARALRLLAPKRKHRNRKRSRPAIGAAGR